MSLGDTLAHVRADLALARDHIVLAERAARDLPSSRIDGAPWGEKKQRLEAALAIARDAIGDADREVM